MGIVVGILVFLVTGFLLAAALQRAAMLKPYVGLFLIAGLMTIAALALGSQFSGLGAWVLLGAKLLAIFSCTAMSTHLAVLVAKRLLANRRTRS